MLSSNADYALCHMFTSDDGGATWREYGPVMYDSGTDHRSLEVYQYLIAESPTHPGVIYAATSGTLYHLVSVGTRRRRHAAWPEVLACLPRHDDVLLQLALAVNLPAASMVA